MTECEQYKGRLRDLCAGVGFDGRPNPTQGACDRYRATIGLSPIVVQRPSQPNHVLAGKKQVSRIGTRVSTYFKSRIGQTPCGWCKSQIEEMNSLTVEEVLSSKDKRIEDIINNAKKHAPWWLKISIKADEISHIGGAAYLIGLFIDEACNEEKMELDSD